MSNISKSALENNGNKYCLLALLATTMFLPTTAQATAPTQGYVNHDWKVVGDNLVTVGYNEKLDDYYASQVLSDPSYVRPSRLEWLDLSVTKNMSYSEVSSALKTGGDLYGWRYATANELGLFWGSASTFLAHSNALGGFQDATLGTANPNTLESVSDGIFNEIAHHWGDLFCEHQGCTEGEGFSEAFIDTTHVSGKSISSIASNLDQLISIDPENPAGNGASDGFNNQAFISYDFYKSMNMGSALVRDLGSSSTTLLTLDDLVFVSESINTIGIDKTAVLFSGIDNDGSVEKPIFDGQFTDEVGTLYVDLDNENNGGVFNAKFINESHPDTYYSGFNINFGIPGDTFQFWDLSYDGVLGTDELVELTFTFDPTGLSLTEILALDIYHYEAGVWTGLGGTVNTDNNTITAFTSSFSPFAIGQDNIPEPSLLVLLSLSLVGIGLSKNKRFYFDVQAG